MNWFFIIWYLCGSVVALFFWYKTYKEVLVRDVLVFMIAGGICGFITLIIQLYFFCDKANFLNKRIL
jgi:TctA family transporter